MKDKEFWRNEKVAFLAIASIKGIGFWSMYKLANSETSYKDALKQFELLADAAPEDVKLKPEEFETQESIWQRGLDVARSLASKGIQLYLDGERDFPKKLAESQDPPKWIFVQGALENLSSPAISIVGTRKPNEDGLFITRYAVSCLAHMKCVTVSGLALGIDQITHTESIRYGIPTVAVLGTGILQNYPKGSESLRNAIIKLGGTVISEYLPNQSYSAENFVRRNRLQAALGEILIPAQWDIKSGTAHTVRFAYKNQKKIVNLYLPDTLNQRPEIDFSKSEYGAIPYEIPYQTEEFINAIRSKILDQELIPVQLEKQEEKLAPKNVIESSSVLEPASDENPNLPSEDTENPQLPLI